MDDLISRQAAIDVADAVWSVTGDKNVAKVWDQIKDLPSAKPERKKGKWINRSLNILYPEWARYTCSVCGEHSNRYDYCPNCGADMRGEQDG